jgi:flagellar motor switch protein FliM
MRKVLTQEEIDNLIRAARSGTGAPAPRIQPPAVTAWDGRVAGQIGQEHMQAINRLHQTFALNLTHSLGAYLRIQFEAALVSGEHLTYGEFLQSIPEVTYLASFKLMPVGISVLLQLDLAVAYPLIDLLLGGEGKGATPERGTTEIEEQVLETVMHIIGRELQSAWQALSLESALAPPPEVPAPEEHDLQVTVAAAGSLRGEMSLRIPRFAVLGLGQLFLQEPHEEAAELTPDHRDALEELLRQVAGQVATALTSRWGDVQLRVEPGQSPTWSAAARGWLVSAPAAPFRLLVEWQLSSALVTALRPIAEKAPASEPAQGVAPPATKLDLLMDAELEVTLRFGKRSMLLREIMELDAGSVVELDRQVQEPVDLLLAGRLIARGEVVVVNGNYGLRVLEVVSPSH